MKPETEAYKRGWSDGANNRRGNNPFDWFKEPDKARDYARGYHGALGLLPSRFMP